MVARSASRKKKALFLPARLYGMVQERAKSTGFGSIDEYITFVLEDVLNEKGEEKGSTSGKEEEEVKKRLRALGYLS